MVIEWLKVRVAPELREQFVQKDEEIWTATLSQYPGFLEKQVWISPDRQDEVVIVIRWASMDAWKSVPADVLDQTEARFSTEMNQAAEIIEATSYQVRKFV